ncbi:MAG: UDP-N-acetylglucosamine 1-carboxyvinyltransferase [Thermodesulfobacteriota bacterium]|nr:UDP-N-acetylglucosamine 1-carboxyvinyltransferase [Thermodesulfobacteriota bacterium]
MDQLLIEGGKKLKGEIEIFGVKNGILPMMAASIMAEKGQTVIHNVPALRDIKIMIKILEKLGAKVHYDKKIRTIIIDAQSINNYRAPYNLVKQMRASFLVMGPLLARFRKAEVSMPGGCVIGVRNVNMHLEALQKLGTQIAEDSGYIIAHTDGLQSTTYSFDFPTHTGTENVMMAACLSKGTTVLINAACEPEIVALAHMLNSMGAHIKGAGTPSIAIEGVKGLSGIECTAIPSRIETGLFMAAGAITGGEIVLKNAITENLSIVTDKMKRMGIAIKELGNNQVLVKSGKRREAINFTTWPFPGFPTDLQAPIMSLLTLAHGTSIIKETIFENRFMHVNELNRMGANIRYHLNEAVVTGTNRLIGTSVMASDLQGGAALVIAALAAEGETSIDRVYHIDRGYEQIETRLASLGASIKRFNPSKPSS